MPVVIPGLNGREKKSEKFPQYPSSASIRLYSTIRWVAEQPTRNENKTTLTAPVQLEFLLQGLRYFQATSRPRNLFSLPKQKGPKITQHKKLETKMRLMDATAANRKPGYEYKRWEGVRTGGRVPTETKDNTKTSLHLHFRHKMCPHSLLSH